MIRYYRSISLAGALGFAAVGAFFLLRPGEVIAFFNRQSGAAATLGLPVTGLPRGVLPLSGLDFYVVLAVAYMYLVAVLAAAMFLHPRQRIYPAERGSSWTRCCASPPNGPAACRTGR